MDMEGVVKADTPPLRRDEPIGLVITTTTEPVPSSPAVLATSQQPSCTSMSVVVPTYTPTPISQLRALATTSSYEMRVQVTSSVVSRPSHLYFYYSKVMFTLLSAVSELYCAYCASVYFISFSHGYSAILAAKLMIKLDLT